MTLRMPRRWQMNSFGTSPSVTDSKAFPSNALTRWNSNGVKFTGSTLSPLVGASNKGLRAHVLCSRSHLSINSSAPLALFRFRLLPGCMTLSPSPCPRLEIPRLLWCTNTEPQTKRGLESMSATSRRQIWGDWKALCDSTWACSPRAWAAEPSWVKRCGASIPAFPQGPLRLSP
jgi:hypothetical protein